VRAVGESHQHFTDRRIGLADWRAAANIAVPINSSVTEGPDRETAACSRICDAGRSVVGRAVAELGVRKPPIQQQRAATSSGDALGLDAILQVDGSVVDFKMAMYSGTMDDQAVDVRATTSLVP